MWVTRGGLVRDIEQKSLTSACTKVMEGQEWCCKYRERPPSLSMALAEEREAVEAVWRCLASLIS